MDAPLFRVASLALSSVVLLAGCSGRMRRPTGPLPDAGPASDAAMPAHDAGPATGHDAGTTPRSDAGTRPALDAGPAGPPGTPAHIEIYSGDGQMVMSGYPGGDRMKVLVTDAAGAPVAGVRVTWAITLGGMGVTGDEFPTGTTGSNVTDASGIARAGLRGEFLSTMSSSVPATVTATSAVGSVTFHAITTYWPTGLPTMPETYISSPSGRDLGSAPHGSVLPAAIIASITFMAGSEMGHGVPQIGMRVLPADPTGDGMPIFSCANATEGQGAGGTVFSDAMGHAGCDLRVPATPGSYTVSVRVGGAVDFGPYFLQAT